MAGDDESSGIFRKVVILFNPYLNSSRVDWKKLQISLTNSKPQYWKGIFCEIHTINISGHFYWQIAQSFSEFSKTSHQKRKRARVDAI